MDGDAIMALLGRDLLGRKALAKRTVVATVMSSVGLERSLAEVGFPTAIDLLATYGGRKADLAPWPADARINRDRRPWLQYQAGWESYTEQTDDVVGAMVRQARDIAKDLGLGERGFRLVLNCGDDAGYSVHHIHLHLLGGRPLGWPPG